MPYVESIRGASSKKLKPFLFYNHCIDHG